MELIPVDIPWLVLPFIVALFALRRYYGHDGKSSLLPPCPGLAMPFIGHLHLLPRNPRKRFLEWAKKLGSIYRLQFGQHMVIVFNGYDVLREAFITRADCFSGRPDTYVANTLSKGKGFVCKGTDWPALRKVTMQIFRQLGLGSNVMETKIQVEVSRFLDHLHDLNGAAFDPQLHLDLCISNIVCRLVFGKSYNNDDEEMTTCARMIGEQVSRMEGVAVLNFLPFLRYLPGDLFGMKKILHDIDYIEKTLFWKQIGKKKEDGSFRNGEIADYISGFLKEIEKHQQDSNETVEASAISEENLIACSLNIFAAGTETTSNTIRWAILFLLHHPQIQDRCYQEIVTHIGLERRPCVEDRKQCTYLDAFLMEVQRITDITPYAIFHTASQELMFRGYLIPKGAIILPNLDSVLLSEEIWGDPHNFRPERHLDRHSNTIIRKPELIPFSLGKRTCIGEGLAKLERFLFISAIIQSFEIRLPDDVSELPPLDDSFGLVCIPHPFRVCFVPRLKTDL